MNGIRSFISWFRRGKASTLPPPKALPPRLICPVCHGDEVCFFAALDFNRSCEDRKGRLLPVSERQVAYFKCAGCDFCFAPEFMSWQPIEFARYIYNADYAQVDPDCAGARQDDQLRVLESLLGGGKEKIAHLDYGSGLRLLSERMNRNGWHSTAYDPYLDVCNRPQRRFDLVTAFEVFEHVPVPDALMEDIKEFLEPDGLLFFSTLLSDGHIAHPPLSWWYAAPRNGHISLYSSKSLALLMRRHGFTLVSLSPLFHYAFAGKPPV